MQRVKADDLAHWATSVLVESGLDRDKAETTAQILVEGELFGHSTHGLALLPAYLRELADGNMTRSGDVRIVSDEPGHAVWDGRYLPGPWLTAEAVDAAVEKASVNGTGSIAIRHAHHIACLQAYLERATKKGYMIIVMSSDPAGRLVAPFGGTRAIITPNPIAVGIPTSGLPILIDVSTSITTLGMAQRVAAEKGRLPGEWVLDGEGNPTDDPSVLSADPAGTLLPLGGVESGHKGFALALMVEALTSGLAGAGRAQKPSRWGASVFVQAIRIDAFGGLEAFVAETDLLTAETENNPPRKGVDAVRMPGFAAQARKRAALRDGVQLLPAIQEKLKDWGETLGQPLPIV